MTARLQSVRSWMLVALIGVAVAGSSGCGYLKNVRDDAMDCFMFGVGVVPPVVPGKEGNQAVGFLPPSLGLYVQVTDFFHFGALYKASADLEWDRRGAGVLIDQRSKIGFGPLHRVRIKQTPICVNAYKDEGNQMDGWREHMRNLRDPVFDAPAKELIFRDMKPQPFLANGWQDWEMISVEIAIPEPFILHSGFNVRAGIDPSQILDFALGLVGIDLYDDNAYRLWGELQFPPEGE